MACLRLLRLWRSRFRRWRYKGRRSRDGLHGYRGVRGRFHRRRGWRSSSNFRRRGSNRVLGRRVSNRGDGPGGGSRSRRNAIGGKTHAPETNRRLGKFQFHIAGDGAVVFRFDNLADNFLFGFFVGDEQQLSRRNEGGQANDGTMTKDEHGLGRLRERLAL